MNLKTMAMITVTALFFSLASFATAMEIHSAKVIMGKHTGKYTFILAEEEDEQRWLAANFIDIAPGDVVEYVGGILMREFHSPAMNHTFEEILLVTNIRIAERVELPGDAEISAMKSAPGEAPIPDAPIAQEVGQVSVAGLFATREDLAGKSVSLKAKVIRVSSNIQGKNWVALTDGTGMAPDNQVMAVTTEQVNLGETVTATGVVRNDHTIGMGHTFKVLLEDARFSR